MSTFKLQRVFHPVGHGAFYTERFYDENSKNFLSVIYDCGAKKLKNLQGIIDREFVKDEAIAALFVSHFHADHVNGIEHLLKRCHIDKIFIPYLTGLEVIEAYTSIIAQTSDPDSLDSTLEFLEMCYGNNNNSIRLEESIVNLDNENVRRNRHILKVETTQKTIVKAKLWEYYPYYVSTGTEGDKLMSAINAILPSDKQIKLYPDGNVDFNSLKTAIEDLGSAKCREVYEDIIGTNHNLSSMTLLSVCPALTYPFYKYHYYGHHNGWLKSILSYTIPKALYMGDFEATKYFDQLKDYYRNNWGGFRVLQVPHHGSDDNWHSGLCSRQRLCVISAPEKGNNGKHPGKSTLSKINLCGGIPQIVTENPNSRLELSYCIRYDY